MVILLAPLAYLGARSLVSVAGKSMIDGEVAKMVSHTFMNIFINVVSILLMVFVVRFFVTFNTFLLLIFSIYFASILHSSMNFIKNLPKILSFIFIHKFSITSLLREEAQKRIDEKNFFERMFIEITGGVNNIVSDELWPSLIEKFLKLVVVMGIYIAVFRLFLLPILVDEYTHFNMFQLALYPFCLSVDYFLGTNLLSLLI